MLKMKKWFTPETPQYLFLASGAKDGEGFWVVGVKNCDENIRGWKPFSCHRKELVGDESERISLII